ncbi:hypothetical protein [Kribbella yunnanensis]
MSWTLMVSPLHLVAADGGLEWAAEASFSYGLPDAPPDARELPTVAEVVRVLREAGCHGDAWFRVPGHGLPTCPAPGDCASEDGLDLGEVGLQVEDSDEDLRPDQAVDCVSFRKPSGRAALVAATALAAVAGPLVVFDDGLEAVVVVSPGDDPEVLAVLWPWWADPRHSPTCRGAVR